MISGELQPLQICPRSEPISSTCTGGQTPQGKTAIYFKHKGKTKPKHPNK